MAIPNYTTTTASQFVGRELGMSGWLTFMAPVKAGARVRPRASLASAEPQEGGRLLLKLKTTLEIENEAKPALVAELLCMLMGKRHDSF